MRLGFFLLVAFAGSALRAKSDIAATRIALLEHSRRLEQEIVNISEGERRRIGQDLHDGLCQYLAALGCAATSLRDDLEKLQLPHEAKAADELAQLLRDAVVQTRDLARGLVPVHLDEEGLVLAMEGLAHSVTRLQGINCTFESKGVPMNYEESAAMHLYRIAQEAINNATKHGKAQNIAISLDATQHLTTLRIADDGAGISRTMTICRGMGLNIMGYRARLTGGELKIEEAERGGTVVSCIAPKRTLERFMNTPPEKTSVVIVEDHPMFREQLAHLISKEPDMVVCGEADNVRDGFALIKEKQPAIAIVDITLKGSSGLELLKDLRAHGIELPTLVLSMHDESLYAERALRAGAKGYITKHEASANVMVAIRQVLSGEIYLKPRFMSSILEQDNERQPRDRPADRSADRSRTRSF